MENLYALLGSVGLPIGVILAVLFFTRNKKSEIAGAVKKAVHSFKQEKSEETIESIEHEQSKVVAVIKDRENMDANVRKRIRAIADKAAEDIEKIKKEKKSIKDIQETIDEGWDDI